MDLIGYDEKRFREIENQIAMIGRGIKTCQCNHYSGILATEGDNVTTKSDKTPWYEGEALLTHLETVDIKEDTEKGFSACRYRESAGQTHEFRGFQGQIQNGSDQSR